jgi:hypothetical protein
MRIGKGNIISRRKSDQVPLGLRLHFENPTSNHLTYDMVKKFSAVFGTRKFIAFSKTDGPFL